MGVVAFAGSAANHAGAGDAQRPKAGAASQWKRVFADPFDRPAGAGASPRKWRYDIGGHGWGSGTLNTYTSRPANVRHDGRGHLLITARRETYTGPDGIQRNYTSGRLNTKRIFAVRYGRIAVRAKAVEGQGVGSVFWMLGTHVNRVLWPRCGEIDILEQRGQEPHINKGAVHGPGPDGEGAIAPQATLDYGRSLANRMHTYEARWTRNRIRFFLDGERYGQVRRRYYPRDAEWVYDHKMFLVLNLRVGARWVGHPDASTPFPVTMEVDWVRVWKPRR
jgi:beta-glucanase (GH16 family)